MANKRMLIDATHPEETRVVVLNGTRLEDFDVEVASRRQLKGNIYLAKVTRVEPSLQAAFVDYGGNRHGFLAFSEIHPDYYQIPITDREALAAEEEKAEMADEASLMASPVEPEDPDDDEVEIVETLGGGAIEEVEERRHARPHRQYKIQEVIKRRQILLVQVVKEERGTKGAALTTYLSLAGRYCVLMPNTARGGGISRKITSATDRKRLKSLVGELDIPEGAAVIVRTAGSDRTKAELKRDYEYLLRLWNSVRELTLESTAPALVYEEGNLIKRSIRDLYSRDIDEIQVAGEEGYKAAKSFMKLLVPSHTKRVQPYRDPTLPMLQRYQVESQLDAINDPIVKLKSGGYIVINPTEALVAIDVNSGRSTKERNIEETALKTNLEAADEVAHQLRLRDLAGLIVIDFIDMEGAGNNAQVERRLKNAMRTDRARIQVGKISAFGLLELSRQRLRPSLLETSFETCIYCSGTGVRRSTESTALYVLRAIEEEGIRHRAAEITVTVPAAVALYILNHKRANLADIELRYNFSVMLDSDDSLIPPDYRIERSGAPLPMDREIALPVYADEDEDESEEDLATETATEDEGKRKRRRRSRRRKKSGEDRDTATESVEATDEREADEGGETQADDRSGSDDSQDAPRSKRRRRGKRGGRRRNRRTEESAATESVASETITDADVPAVPESTETDATVTAELAIAAESIDLPAADVVTEAESDGVAEAETVTSPEAEAETEAKPTRRRRATRKSTTARKSPRKAKTKVEDETSAEPAETAEPEAASADTDPAEEEPKPRKTARRSRSRSRKKAEEPVASTEPADSAEPPAAPEPATVQPASEAEPEPRPTAVEPMPRAEPEPEPEPEPESNPSPDEEQVPAYAKTTVIDVDSQPTEARQSSRRGWWQRLVK